MASAIDYKPSSVDVVKDHFKERGKQPGRVVRLAATELSLRASLWNVTSGRRLGLQVELSPYLRSIFGRSDDEQGSNVARTGKRARSASAAGN